MNEFVLTIHQMRFLEIMAMCTINERDTIPLTEVIELYRLYAPIHEFMSQKFLKRFNPFGSLNLSDPSTCSLQEMI